MYLIQLLNPLLTPDIEQRLENALLKPIQPGQSLSSGWVERTPEGMIEFSQDEDHPAILATYMVEERKLSKKDIKLEADARAKTELQKHIETGQSRYVDPATGAVNTKAIRQDVMDELLEKSIPKRTSITVEFLPGKIVAFHTNNALHLDSVLHALAIDDEIEWRLNVLDMPEIRVYEVGGWVGGCRVCGLWVLVLVLVLSRGWLRVVLGLLFCLMAALVLYVQGRACG
jgi:hypothetical protein